MFDYSDPENVRARHDQHQKELTAAFIAAHGRLPRAGEHFEYGGFINSFAGTGYGWHQGPKVTPIRTT
jgi:hypothetical protein